MILERPLFGKVDIQALNDDDEWESLIPDATLLSIRRGGARDGIAVRTDVGLATFTLKDAQDPMNGGTLRPGQAVRIVSKGAVQRPDEIVYSQSFETDSAGWVQGAAASSMTRPATFGRTGTHHLYTPGGAGVRAYRDFAGLEPGSGYTARIYALRGNGSGSFSVGVTGIGTGTPVPADWDWSTFAAFGFVASSASHRIELRHSASANISWDDFTLTKNAWTEIGDSPIFTGRIAHLNSLYPLNKQTGESRAMIQVTVADAVQIHGSTIRYGVQIEDGFETFEERIGRLASSAQAPVEVPLIGDPIVRYSF